MLQASGDLSDSPSTGATEQHQRHSRQPSTPGRPEPASASSAALFAAWAGSAKHAEWRVVQWVVTYLLPQLLEALRKAAQLETGDTLLRSFAAAVKATCQTFGRLRAQLAVLEPSWSVPGHPAAVLGSGAAVWLRMQSRPLSLLPALKGNRVDVSGAACRPMFCGYSI
jgi:hypothetical protein